MSNLSSDARTGRNARGSGRYVPSPHEISPHGSRRAIDAVRGAVVVEFGMPWGEHNRLVEPLLASVFARHPDVHHVKIEDGDGRRLSRLFNVKLWPTLIFLNDGKEIARLVRPNNIDVIDRAFNAVTDAAAVDAIDNEVSRPVTLKRH